MIRPRIAATAASLMSLLVLGVSLRTADAEDATVPTIKKAMQALHKGANSPLATLKKSLASNAPDWKQVQDKTKDFVILGASLAKNDPPKGEKTSWTKLADSYFGDSKAMDDAAKKKDLKGTRDAFKSLSSSCMACHKAHKG